jgi:hypothetical protein
MTLLPTTSKIQGQIGELVFEHFCQKNKYAYISLDEIYNSSATKNMLRFRFGDRRIAVRIPDDIAEEIHLFSVPINRDDYKPNYVYDFLTVSLLWSFTLTNDRYIPKPYLSKKAFNWIEIKTGKAKLSLAQKRYKRESLIGVQIFRINTDLPQTFDVTWDRQSEKGTTTPFI